MMTRLQRPRMPANWDNARNWQRYYTRLLPNYSQIDHWYGAFLPENAYVLMQKLKELGKQLIWFSGCGFDPLPRLFASYGFTVYATDYAKAAIEYQNRNLADLAPLKERIIKSDITKNSRQVLVEQAGDFYCEVHDFRKPYHIDSFDVILNIRAFQSLSDDALIQAAQTHFNALKPGGQAIFDCINVSISGQLRLEGALATVGFPIHGYENLQWLDAQLRATGFPLVPFFAGMAIPRTGEYQDEEKWRQGMKIIKAINQEYRIRLDKELEAHQLHNSNNVTKSAEMVYGSG